MSEVNEARIDELQKTVSGDTDVTSHQLLLTKL